MFTAMISRRHVLIAIPVLALGLGVGWVAFELGRGRVADVPTTQTSTPAAEQAIGEAGGPPSAAPPASALGAASGSDRGAGAATEQVDPLPPAVPEQQAERRTGLAEQPPVQTERSERDVQPPTAEADGQAGAPSSPGGPESPSPSPPESAAVVEPALPTPPAAPQAAPSLARDVPEPPAPERSAAASAPPAAGADDQRAAQDQAAAPEAAPGTRGVAGKSHPGPSPAQPPLAEAERAAPQQPPQPRTDETAALAEAAPAERADEAAPHPRAAPPPRAPEAASGAPADDELARPTPTEPPASQTSPATARAAESLRRALATLFGGAADQEGSPAREDAEVAALPESAPAPSTPGGAGDPAAGPPPSFDIVRIAPDGGAVIAGRAAPSAEVEIRSGDRIIDRVSADRRGEWVSVPPAPLGAGVQELTLAAQVAGRLPVASEEVVVVAIPERPDPPPPDLALPGADVAPPRLAAAPVHEEAFAVALPREGDGKGRILQAPGRISSEGALALEMLDYDDAGRIRLSGEASAGAALRIYVDNEPAGATVVGPAGRWDAVLEPTLAPGDYTLRLDQLSPSGEPDARIETPFTRVSRPPVEGELQLDYVIVQPGNSLWRIARRVLGEGMHYVHIFEANQTQIRDPDLIYPGQVFEVPSAIGAAG